jgi:phospholipase C
MTSKSRRNFLKQSVGAAGAGIALQALPISIRDALAIQPAADGDWSKGLEHVVILMLENRSFDHMFGSLRGVRGFGDPKPMPMQAITKTVWNQPDFSGNYVYPFHIARDPGLSNTGDETPKCHGLNHAWRGDTSVYPSWKYWDHWTNKAYQSQLAENLGGMRASARMTWRRCRNTTEILSTEVFITMAASPLTRGR